MNDDQYDPARPILTILLVIATLVIILGHLSFSWVFPSSMSHDARITLVSALVGGLLVFFLGRLDGLMNAIRDRHRRHVDALAKLHAELEEHRNIADDNLYLADKFRDALREGKLYWSRMQTYQLNKSHYTELHDVNLISRLFDYNETLRKINDDIRAIQDGYILVQNAFIDGSIDNQAYHYNAELLAGRIEALAVIQQQFRDGRIVTLIVRVRLVLKKSRTPFMRFRALFLNTEYSISDEELAAETRVVERESSETMQASRAEIQQAEDEIQRRQQQ